MSRSTTTPQPGSIAPSMSQQQLGSVLGQENLFEFRKSLLSILNKFSDAHTLKTGIDEIKRFMMNDITDTDRMNVFLNALADHNEHMKPQQKKEYIKIYGVAAEIFEESLIQFLPKILSNLQKKIKEETPQMHSAVSDTLGQLVLHIIEKVEDYSEKKDLLQTFLKLPFTLLEKSPNKAVQTGASQCLSKVIQNSPEEVLTELLGEVVDKLISIINLNQFKAHTPLLECVISLIFHVESDFCPYAHKFLPVLLGFIACNEWSTKKVAIDAIYSMSAILKDEIVPFRLEILQVLNHCRFDKIKPVRDATLETIKLIKELGPPLDDDQLAQIDGKGASQKLKTTSKNVQSNQNNNANNGRSGSNSSRAVIKKSFTEGSLSDEGYQPTTTSTKSIPTSVATKQAQKKQVNRKIEVMTSTSFGTKDNNESDQDIGTGKTNKKVSAATLKRRAAAAFAQSPLRESQHTNFSQLEDTNKNVSPMKKEFKSIFAQKKNPNFFQESQDIEIFEGKKTQNYELQNQAQPQIVQPQILHQEVPTKTVNKKVANQSDGDKGSNSSSTETQALSKSGNGKRTTRIERQEISKEAIKKQQEIKAHEKKHGRFQKPVIQKTNQDAFDNIQIFEPKHATLSSKVQASGDKKLQKEEIGEIVQKVEEKQQDQLNDMSFNNNNQQELDNQNSQPQTQQECYSQKYSHNYNQPLSQQKEHQNQFESEESKIAEGDMIYSYRDSQRDIDQEEFQLRRNSGLSNNQSKNVQVYQNNKENYNKASSIERRLSYYEGVTNSSNIDYPLNNEVNLTIRNSNEVASASPNKILQQQQITPGAQGVFFNGDQFQPQQTQSQYTSQILSHKKQPQSFDETSQSRLIQQYSQYDNQSTTSKQSAQAARASQFVSGFTGASTSVGVNNHTPTNQSQHPPQQMQISQSMNKLEQMNVQLVMLQLEKMSQQQKQMQETLATLQDGMRSELSLIKQKVNDMENSMLDLKINCNSKINGEQVRDIVDKKMAILQDYRRDADQMNKRCFEMTSQFKSNMGIQPSSQNNNQAFIYENNNNQIISSNVQTDNSNHESSLSSSFFEKNSEWHKTDDDKKQSWKNIVSLIQKHNYEDSFQIALNSDDEMLLIRLLSKTGSFEFDKISATQREEILRKSLSLIEGKEFVDILLPCMAEVVERYHYLWPLKLKKTISERLAQMKDDKELTEIQRCELKRISEKIRNIQ